MTNWYERDSIELQKEFLLDNGNKVFFKKNPPHGHWTIHFEKGEMSPKLQGQFTDFSKAYRAFENYLANKTRRYVGVVGEIKDGVIGDVPHVPEAVIDELNEAKKAPKAKRK